MFSLLLPQSFIVGKLRKKLHQQNATTNSTYSRNLFRYFLESPLTIYNGNNPKSWPASSWLTS